MALFAFALAAVSAPAEPAQNAAKKRPVHPWTIPSLDDKFNKDEANFNRYATCEKQVPNASSR